MDIQIKRGTAKARKSCADVLKDGQPFLEKDTGVLYMGDGETQLKDLVPIYPANLYEHTIRIKIKDKESLGAAYAGVDTYLRMWLELKIDSPRKDYLIANEGGVAGEDITITSLEEMLKSDRGELRCFFCDPYIDPYSVNTDRYPFTIPSRKDIRCEPACLYLKSILVPKLSGSMLGTVYMSPLSGTSDYQEQIAKVWEFATPKQPTYAELNWINQELS